MVHIDPDFKTKKAFIEALTAGREISIYTPGPFPLSNNGTGIFVIEAPANFHKWYCKVSCTEGKIVKVVK